MTGDKFKIREINNQCTELSPISEIFHGTLSNSRSSSSSFPVGASITLSAFLCSFTSMPFVRTYDLIKWETNNHNQNWRKCPVNQKVWSNQQWNFRRSCKKDKFNKRRSPAFIQIITHIRSRITKTSVHNMK